MTTGERNDSPRSAACQTDTVDDSSESRPLGDLAASAAIGEEPQLAALYAPSVTAKIWHVASKRLNDVRMIRFRVSSANVVPAASPA